MNKYYVSLNMIIDADSPDGARQFAVDVFTGGVYSAEEVNGFATGEYYSVDVEGVDV